MLSPCPYQCWYIYRISYLILYLIFDQKIQFQHCILTFSFMRYDIQYKIYDKIGQGTFSHIFADVSLWSNSPTTKAFLSSKTVTSHRRQKSLKVFHFESQRSHDRRAASVSYLISYRILSFSFLALYLILYSYLLDERYTKLPTLVKQLVC